MFSQVKGEREGQNGGRRRLMTRQSWSRLRRATTFDPARVEAGSAGHSPACLRLVLPEIIEAQFAPILIKDPHVGIAVLDQRQHAFQRGFCAVPLIAIFPKGSSRGDDIPNNDTRLEHGPQRSGCVTKLSLQG